MYRNAFFKIPYSGGRFLRKKLGTGPILGVPLQNITLFLKSTGGGRAVYYYDGAPGGAGLGPPFFDRFPFSWPPAMQIDSICNIL